MNQKFGPQYALFYPCLLCVQVFNFGLKGRAKLRGTTPKGILSETKATPLPTPSPQNLTKLAHVVAFFRLFLLYVSRSFTILSFFRSFIFHQPVFQLTVNSAATLNGAVLSNIIVYEYVKIILSSFDLI